MWHITLPDISRFFSKNLWMFSYDLPPGLLLITSDIYSKIRFYYQQLLERFGKFILHRYGWSEEKKKKEKTSFAFELLGSSAPVLWQNHLDSLDWSHLVCQKDHWVCHLWLLGVFGGTFEIIETRCFSCTRCCSVFHARRFFT